jgi:chlorite dismutase
VSEERPEEGELDVRERGRDADGRPIRSDRRLFMQLLAFGRAPETAGLVAALDASPLSGVLYEDVNDAAGVALLTFAEHPDAFLTELRPFLRSAPFADLEPKPDLTMLGRTYSIGYESDLDTALVERPAKRVVDPALPWAVWYPLRRAGSFARLTAKEQEVLLLEHAGIGRAFGRAGLAYDIRLACFGLDRDDNDFVIGLLGAGLHPLSAVVQRMRKTKQTSLHMDRLGPFFVGKAVWQRRR